MPAPQPPEHHNLSRAKLKVAAIEGVRWMALARLAAELLTLGSSIVLAHLVSPRQFGMLAVAVIVRELALMTANEGVGSPLVQRRDIGRAHLEAGVMLALGMGLALSLFTLLVVPLATTPLFGAETTQLFRLFSPSFLLVAIMVVPLAQLQRELRFRRIGMIEVCGVLASAAVSLGLAFAGLEAKAYVLGMLTGLAVLAVATRPASRARCPAGTGARPARSVASASLRPRPGWPGSGTATSTTSSSAGASGR